MNFLYIIEQGFSKITFPNLKSLIFMYTSIFLNQIII